ncbi:Meiotically up-regulated gene 113 [Bradyrhizobium brasilense]|uniref:Meiotically up-regulated gene 113 n=1 Tax=Bradyrhizobium brasilense TaxID=1419277 RepID=A0A1G6IIM0_9BRAD|nr:GIY-YIG nuclease family protein [Bradyrhizobium brasilense]SDC05576.1 Meiotically up-regulated gene 113 [Bradyrhizobium brasilense]
MGFKLASFGTEMTDETLARARTLNDEWDRRRKAAGNTHERPNSLEGANIYVVGFGPYIKIGYSTDLRRRIEDLECRLPEPLVIHATFPGSRKIEAALHGKYDGLRLRGEWFRNEGPLAAWVNEGCPFNGKSWSKIIREA